MATPDEEKIATPDEHKMETSDEHTKSTPDEHKMETSDEHTKATPDEQTVTTPDERTLTTPNEQTLTTQNDHTISNEHTMEMSNEHTVTISNEHTMANPDEHTMIISNDHTMAAPDEHAMVISNDHTMVNPDEHALVISNDHTMTTPDERALVISNEHTMETDYEHTMATPDENKMITTTPEVNNELPNSETQPNKRRKKKSIVWEHFTIENVSAGCRRACCKQCKQSFAYSTGSKVAGTSHLKRHIAKGTCPALLHTALSHAVAACLSDWSLESKLFSLTFSQSLSEAALETLRPLLAIKNPLILNGQLLVGNCVARTFSSVAKDVLGSGEEIIKKIRDSVKYVKTSESHEEKFFELKRQLQVPSERSLCLDDQSQWNTTYQMLVAASELKEVFSCLDTSDPDYKEAPSMEDWKQVETLCTYLKLLFEAASILTYTTNPTAITFFHEVWKIQTELVRAVMSEDPFVSNVARIMLEKTEKYWKDCSLVLAIAVVMDPRFKMKLVEFSFTKIYGEDAPTYIKIVDDGIHELFHEYVTLPLPLTPTYADEGNAGSIKQEESQGGTLLSDNGLTDFDVYIMETTSQQMKSELDQYLEESLLPRVQDFDVLGAPLRGRGGDMDSHASEWDLKDLLVLVASRLGGFERSSKISLFLLHQIRSHVIAANKEKDGLIDGNVRTRTEGAEGNLVEHVPFGLAVDSGFQWLSAHHVVVRPNPKLFITRFRHVPEVSFHVQGSWLQFVVMTSPPAFTACH
ncbi:hypothetical protein CMV_003794 [Castanea mollissima]|uniref:BED-type domain-containing protein n=1 Tax=Castanea mollissima TaxID=60419 RepID=A0A8J4RSM2_9ROSI|nr:hypothetical protein CMV_003794 [Castanea mollissima]